MSHALGCLATPRDVLLAEWSPHLRVERSAPWSGHYTSVQGVPRDNLDIISGGYFNSSASRGGSQEISHDIAEIDGHGISIHLRWFRLMRGALAPR